jgi:hypothetical protein
MASTLQLDSNWPKADRPDLIKISATIRGAPRLPESRSALCDMLDSKARAIAEQQGLQVEAVAGDAVPGDAEVVVAEKALLDAKTGKPTGETVPVMGKVPTLSRAYWCARA